MMKVYATKAQLESVVARIKCERNHLFFSRYFFKHRQGHKFKVNWHHQYVSEEMDKVLSGIEGDLVINIPPGSSKTELAVINLMAHGLAINPRSRFIHISSAKDLVLLNSQTVRDIIQSDEFQELWPLEIAPDAKSKQRWNVMLDGKKAGGVYAVPLGGQITGFRAGYMSDGFQGCFPYDELITTDSGPMPIGDIVTKKMKVNVATYCEADGTTVYAPIDHYWENGPNDIIRVRFSDGTSLTCTPDHELLTAAGWVPAIHLANVLNLVNAQSSTAHGLRPAYAPIIDNFDDALAVLLSCVPESIRQALCDANPCLAHFNLPDNAGSDTVTLCQYTRAISALEYFNNFYAGEPSPRSPLQQRECAVPDSVLHVIGLSAIRQIANMVVDGIPIQMPNLVLMGSFAYKLLCNQMRDIFNPDISAHTKADPLISMAVAHRLKRSDGNCPSDLSAVRDLIKSVGVADRTPIGVDYIGHVGRTYCLSVGGNRNFILHETGVVASNCIIIDDPLKADQAYSESDLKKANRRLLSTVKSRKAKPNTPVIVVMQRLSEKDCTGFIKGGNMPGKWRYINIPALIDDDYVRTLPKHIQAMIDLDKQERDDKGRFSYWPEKEPLQELLDMEAGKGNDAEGNRISKFVFSSQYQQAPTALGGNIIKGEKFVRVSILPKMLYRMIYADTAQKTAERNDFSVFQCWGIGIDKRAYLLDQIRGKWEAPDLKARAHAFWTKHRGITDPNMGQLRKMKVEDKASGTGLIQDFSRAERDIATGQIIRQAIPVEGIERNKDKLTRVMDVLPYIEAGVVCLIEGEPYISDFITECEAFTADDSHAHDDQIDPMCDAIIDLLGPKPRSFFS